MGYENPDMPGVVNGLKKFNAVAISREYDFIPSLQERLSLAARFLNQSLRTVVDKTRKIEVVVDNAGFAELLEQWTAIQAHEQLSVEVQTSAVTVLNDTCAQRVGRIVNVVGAAKDQVEQLAVEGEGLNLEHYSDPLLAYDAARLEEFEQQALGLQLEEDKLRGDKQVLDAAIAVLQSRTWLDHVADLLPTSEQILALVTAAQVAKADADLVMAAIERVTHYLGLFDGGYRLFSLTEARNKITDKLFDVRAVKNKNNADARVLKERADKIRRHAELVEARAYWVCNMRLVASGISVFLTRLSATTQVHEGSMRQVLAELAGFQRFLRRISR